METLLVVSSVFLWLVVALNLLLTIALARRVNATSPQSAASLEKLLPGQPAPDFAAQTMSGETVTLSTYAGHRTAFVFISTHCSPCKLLLPHLESLLPKATRAGVTLVLVSADELEATQTFAEEMSISLPILVAPRMINPFLQDYKSTFTPFYCLIDEQGNVESTDYPSLDGGTWKALTDSWAGGESLVVSKRRSTGAGSKE